MHTDALLAGERVLVIDDVLATGGTARATADLVEQSGASVHALAMLLELSFLPGREAIGDLPLTVLHTV
jgi:adenine phosphoribosyltransferase